MNQNQNTPPKWLPVKLFTNDDVNSATTAQTHTALRFAVRVSKLAVYHPRYSVEVGIMLPPKMQTLENAQPRQLVNYDPATWRFMPHFQFGFTTANGLVMCTDNASIVIAALLDLARQWVREEIQEHEDAVIERKQQRELADANRNKLVTPVTGKTARKREYAASVKK